MRWNNTMVLERQPRSRRRIAIAGVLAAAALFTFVVARADARPAPLTEAGVVAIFDLANTADIETGSLGEQHGTTKEIREYGMMLRTVHVAVRQKGRDLAAKLGVTPAMPDGNTMAKDHAAAVARLKSLHGAEFDRAFLEHEQAFHAAVLAAVKSTLLPAIQNKELKDFVTSLAPAFEAHRLAAENLKSKLAK
jgi:putative membrane protein